jgi:septum site-determining protein MinC
VQPFELKGRTAALTVLRLGTNDLDAITSALAVRTEASPAYFKNSLCLIDLEGLQTLQALQTRRNGALQPAALDVTALVSALRGFGMAPVLLKGGDEAQQAAAVGLGLGVVKEAPPSGRGAPPEAPEETPPDEREHAREQAPGQNVTNVATNAAPEANQPQEAPEPNAPAPTRWGCKVVRQHVRAGQRVYARDGDLVVFGSVNPGAEVMADGSIHIYGALRGRAMAGAQGNDLGRIFCQQMHAELVAVAGVYLTSETMDPGLLGRQAQVSLRDNSLAIEPIESNEKQDNRLSRGVQ